MPLAREFVRSFSVAGARANAASDLLDDATGAMVRLTVKQEGRFGAVKFILRDYLPKAPS